jgi:hypothetical protein
MDHNTPVPCFPFPAFDAFKNELLSTKRLKS